MANKVAIYIRVSTTHQIDKDSLPMQRQDLTNYCKYILATNDYVIFEDAGFSGKNTQRPKYKEMMAQINKGLFTHVLVWKIDRISRNLIDFATMYDQLKKIGVTFISKNEQFDTSTAIGEAMLKIILVFAELERAMASERVIATMISRASNGQFNGGRIPLGYVYNKTDKTFSINNNDADIIHMIFDMCDQNKSVHAIAQYLNDNNYRTKANNLWDSTTIQTTLRNPFYIGEYTYNKGRAGRKPTKDQSEWVIIKDHHPAIIDSEQFERVSNLLDSRNNLPHKYERINSPHIFGGLLYCSYCNKPLQRAGAQTIKGIAYSRYTCPSKRYSDSYCSQPSVSDIKIGSILINYILNMLNAQKHFDNIETLWDLQQELLRGAEFKHIGRIDEDGLRNFYNILCNSEQGLSIYGKPKKSKRKPSSSAIEKLRAERQKQVRALERLTNIYLYSDNSIDDGEFIDKRTVITDRIASIDKELNLVNDDESSGPIADSDFVARASEFIIAQELRDKQYIDFRRLMSTIDHTVIKEFFVTIIDNVIMEQDKVRQITFKNGLTQRFIFK